MGYDKTGHFTTRDVDGYSDCPIKLITSGRGPGKSFGMKRKIIASPNRAVWLFRDSEDLQSSLRTWLDDLTMKTDDRTGLKYAPERFEIDSARGSGELRMDGDVKVYFRCISYVGHIKHETFPLDVDTVVWDEFVPLVKRKMAGVDSEAQALMDILKTIDHDIVNPRKSKLRVYLFANPRDFTNDIFRFFRVDATLGFGVRRTMPGVVWEFLEAPPQKEDPFSGLADSVNANLESWKDASHFVGEMPKGSVPKYSVRNGSEYFGLYRDQQRRCWVKAIDAHLPGVFHYGSDDNLRRDEISIERTGMRKYWLDGHQSGLMRYQSLNVKTAFLEMVGL